MQVRHGHCLVPQTRICILLLRPNENSILPRPNEAKHHSNNAEGSQLHQELEEAPEEWGGRGKLRPGARTIGTRLDGGDSEGIQSEEEERGESAIGSLVYSIRRFREK